MDTNNYLKRSHVIVQYWTKVGLAYHLSTIDLLDLMNLNVRPLYGFTVAIVLPDTENWHCSEQRYQTQG